MFDRTQVIQEKIFFWFYSFFFFSRAKWFFLSFFGLFYSSVDANIFFVFVFVFSFNICLIHKEKHAFFHFFHSVFCIFSGLLFIFFSFGFGISGLKERADFFCITWVLMGGFFVLLFFFSILIFFLFFTCLLFCDLKWIE